MQFQKRETYKNRAKEKNREKRRTITKVGINSPMWTIMEMVSQSSFRSSAE